MYIWSYTMIYVSMHWCSNGQPSIKAICMFHMWKGIQLMIQMWQDIHNVQWFEATWEKTSGEKSFNCSTSLLSGSFHDFTFTTICKWLFTFVTGKWSLSCSFKVPLQLNVLPHFEQANGFSTVWILSWFSNHHYL